MGEDKLEKIQITHQKTGEMIEETDHLSLIRLKPSLGPIGSWGLILKMPLRWIQWITRQTFQEFVRRDVNTYQNKLKLILCGFMSTLAVQSAFARIHPEKRMS